MPMVKHNKHIKPIKRAIAVWIKKAKLWLCKRGVGSSYVNDKPVHLHSKP
jgi:hypothetical protein